MEADMNTFSSLVLPMLRHARTAATLSMLGAAGLLAGCVMDPPGPSPIYSRLPADQAGTATHPLTPEERARYDAIEQQVLAEQDQAMATEAAAQAWSRYYSPPVSVYGSYYGGGWGHGWGTGVGVGVGYPGWGWGW